MAPISTPPALPSNDSFYDSSESTRSRLSDPEVLPAGFELGNYVVRVCVGQGAMGSVYRAEHTLLKKEVALKVMDPVLLGSTAARERFRREARAAAAIQHPNVVAITDTGVFDGLPYIVMELLDGIDLERHLEQYGALSEEAVAALALPLVAALGVAHDRGVVHRDLKPSNIFLARGLEGELVPKVLDFGISKFAAMVGDADAAMTPFDLLMGTPLYLPPEAVHGSHAMTPQSDQYSLAVVLYECITGKTPFEPSSLLNVLNAVAQGQFEPPRKLRPDISAALEGAILRAMSADPASRFPDIRGLGRALLEVADVRTQTLWGPAFSPKHPAAETTTLPISLQASAKPKKPARFSKPAARWRSLAGIVLAILVIGVLWTMARRGTTPLEATTPAPADDPIEPPVRPVVVASPTLEVPGSSLPTEPGRASPPNDTAARKSHAAISRKRGAASRRAERQSGAPSRGGRRAPAPADDELQTAFSPNGRRVADPSTSTQPSARRRVRNEAPLPD